jgi:serine protease Do
VAVKLIRDGKPLDITAEVGRLEDGEKLVAAQGPTGLETNEAKALGMTLSILSDEQRRKFNVDADLKGVVVTAVEPGGPAAEKRIEPGDVITEAGRKPVTNPGDVPAQVKDAENSKKNSVLLYVAKGGKQSDMRFIAVKIK